eukprot:GHRR01025010.1.p1 GENE.GHRR01025010.1~~GHRR01025010.1.p1  ORF type:complete len:434 (+),score=148.31 GHRR01025010.1:930-2231(+)
MTGFWLVQDMHQQQMRRQPRCKLASAGCPGTQQQQQLAKRKEGPELIQRQRQQHQLAAAGSSCCLPPQLQAFLDSNETGPLLYVQPQHQRQQDVQPGQQQQLQQQQHHCSGSGTGSLLVDFGSMGCLGLLTDATLLVQVVAKALQLLDWHGVLMTNGWTGLTDAHAALNPVGQQRLYLQTKALHCHHLLLESVDVVLHHGGSGTTAVALAAGVPQLICPLQYDQFYWAERMADLGCSPDPPVSAELLLPQYQQHGMVAVDRPSVGRTASQQRELAATMAGQDEQMQQWQPQERDDHTLLLQGEGWQQQRFEAAVEGGGAYLASQVLAARAQHMLDISASLKMVGAQHTSYYSLLVCRVAGVMFLLSAACAVACHSCIYCQKAIIVDWLHCRRIVPPVVAGCGSSVQQGACKFQTWQCPASMPRLSDHFCCTVL